VCGVTVFLMKINIPGINVNYHKSVEIFITIVVDLDTNSRNTKIKENKTKPQKISSESM